MIYNTPYIDKVFKNVGLRNESSFITVDSYTIYGRHDQVLSAYFGRNFFHTYVQNKRTSKGYVRCIRGGQ